MQLVSRLNQRSLDALGRVLSPMDLVMIGQDRLARAKASTITIKTGTSEPKAAKPKAKKVKVARRKISKAKVAKTVLAAIKKEVKRAISALSASKAQVVVNRLGRRPNLEKRSAFKGIQVLQTLAKEVSGANALDRRWITSWQYAKGNLEGLYRALKFAGVKLAF